MTVLDRLNVYDQEVTVLDHINVYEEDVTVLGHLNVYDQEGTVLDHLNISEDDVTVFEDLTFKKKLITSNMSGCDYLKLSTWKFAKRDGLKSFHRASSSMIWS